MNDIGECPVCGKPVLESSKGFYCCGFRRGGKGCSFALWKDHPYLKKSGIDLDRIMMKHLLTQGYHRMNRFTDYGRPYSIKLSFEQESLGKDRPFFRVEYMRHHS